MAYRRQEQLIADNRREYGALYEGLRWIDTSEARDAAERREAMLARLTQVARIGCKNAKLDCNSLSPGCRICTEGNWSCLFINGQCNCRCFYCPTPQDEVGEPSTHSVCFSDPEDYADYIARFGFKGVSISGGEPMLTPDRTLGYLNAIKRRFGDGIYLWMYSNGTLLTQDRLLELRDAGLDEIRLDIGAVGYDLKKAQMAVGIIGRVTVEIPAISEDEALLKQKIIEMRDIGVNHLNLHQLRLTPHNYKHLAGRNYTFLHGEKVTVLESEMTALNLMDFAFEHVLGLPINYCSFAYKHRFQGATARRRNAEEIRAGFEDVTGNGYIRRLCLVGDRAAITRQVDRFRKKEVDDAWWSVDAGAGRIFFCARIRDEIAFESFDVNVAYFEAFMRPAVSYFNPFREVRLNVRKAVVVERRLVSEIALQKEELPLFEAFIEEKNGEMPMHLHGKKWREVEGYERMPSGFQPYF